MKTLKTILAALLVTTLVTSCKKNENHKPQVTYGQVTFEVLEMDSTDANYSKHIRYGYDDKIIDVVVNGSFKIVMDVPASSTSSDKRNIFLSCETESLHDFKVKFSQYISNSNIPHMNFNCYASGTCPESYRELTHTTVIDF